MARSAILLLCLLIVECSGAAGTNREALGYSEETTIVAPGTDACASGVLIHNHDGSFENAYLWQYQGVVPPYDGAFGEAYNLGAGTISCAAIWLTTIPGYYFPMITDCYVWDGGVGGVPGTVLAVVPDAELTQIPYWPTVGQNDIDVNVAVGGPFTVGYWGPWPDRMGWYFCGADLNGPAGHPWTCIAPGIGYPSGWQDPSLVWGPTSSMGCGVYFEQGTPVESETWGSVKALYR